ncbi:MAG: ribbon-helix-helix domain-containing protein [Cyanobacteriota bacterium]
MLSPLFRKPKRISITISYRLYSELVERSLREGRSISNLASFLLEDEIGALQVRSVHGDDRRAA